MTMKGVESYTLSKKRIRVLNCFLEFLVPVNCIHWRRWGKCNNWKETHLQQRTKLSIEKCAIEFSDRKVVNTRSVSASIIIFVKQKEKRSGERWYVRNMFASFVCLGFMNQIIFFPLCFRDFNGHLKFCVQKTTCLDFISFCSRVLCLLRNDHFDSMEYLFIKM